jgi:hypothetical protein
MPQAHLVRFNAELGSPSTSDETAIEPADTYLDVWGSQSRCGTLLKEMALSAEEI